jgi:hypothetical protein
MPSLTITVTTAQSDRIRAALGSDNDAGQRVPAAAEQVLEQIKNYLRATPYWRSRDRCWHSCRACLSGS